MSGFGILSLLAGALQLTVPSYALRLVRRFGAQRVGWFLVLAFCCFALLHLFKPFHPFNTGPNAGSTLDLACVLASVLLLIGMGHLETLCAAGQQSERKEHQLRAKIQTAVQEQTAELLAAKEELLQEISRLRQREKVLKESEAQYRSLFHDNPQPMWILDLRTCRFLAVNQAALRHFGYSRDEFMALTPRDLMPAETAAAFLQDFARPCFRAESRGRWAHSTKDLSIIQLDVTALDLKFADCPARLMLLHDVTQRHRRETEARRKAKLELVSQVAGGMAHHFNNLLTIIQGHTHILLLDNAQGPKAPEQLKQISTAASRAAALTRQLLTAGGSQPQSPEPVELSGLLRKLNPMLRRLVGERIALQIALAPRLSPLFADPRFLEHIIVHLVLNARDAMPSEGKLTLATEAVRFASSDPLSPNDARTGTFVRLSVRDTGCGMTPEVQAHLFEPFYTTRDIGQATGLGLASVYGAVNQLSGWIEFTSAPGAGTEFRIFLPCATPEQIKPAT